MFTREGHVGSTGAIWWNGRSIDGKHVPHDFAKRKAETMCGNASAAFKFVSFAESGVVPTSVVLPFAEALSLTTPEKVSAFLSLYGYWLGDGSLMFKAYGGRDAVHFSIVKLHDVEWLISTFTTLGLVKDVHYTMGSGAVGSGAEHKIYVTEPNYVTLFHTEYRHKYATGDPCLRRPTTVEGRRLGQRTTVVLETTAEVEYSDISTAESSCMKPETVKSAKWFASWVWNCDKSQLRYILSGLRRADGSEAHDENMIYTSSTRFRDELVRVCLHAGYTPRFTAVYLPGTVRGISRTGTPIVAKHTNWRVSYADGGMYSEPVLRAATDIKEISYTGRTWCVNMPHGFIVTRRAVQSEGEVVKASTPVILGNCVAAHGTAEFMKETMMEKSDQFQCYICKNCGLIGQVNPKVGIYKCTSCENSVDFAPVRIPYAYKLFLQELESMAICSRLLPESRMRAISKEIGAAMKMPAGVMGKGGLMPAGGAGYAGDY
jgi:DNA-directed RNA polymerase II subunit RPB2